MTRSFPTRRSSVLARRSPSSAAACRTSAATTCSNRRRTYVVRIFPHAPSRSEEHTSELQSLMRKSYAVFCLKNNNHESRDHRNTQLQQIVILHGYIPTEHN